MYSYLSKISSEIYIFNLGYVSPDSLFTWARIWGSVVIFRSQNGVREQKSLGNTAVDVFHFICILGHFLYWSVAMPVAMDYKPTESHQCGIAREYFHASYNSAVYAAV
jgi:hypothetical protein